jgi:DNA-binding transcriptional ArsR family regulator
VKLKREEILKALKEAGTPPTIEELSQQTGIDIVRLRVDLFRLAEEGKVERRQRANKSVWTIKVSTALEQRCEKLSKKYSR